MDVEIVQNLLSVLLHEPCICHDHVGPFLYLCHPPLHFPKYLSEFTDKPNCVIDGALMEECCGLGGNNHLFMVAEGKISKCFSCKRYVCQTCKFSFEDNFFVMSVSLHIEC